jgi:Zn-dependent M28 family amino/carboxypeptidase
MTGGEEQGTGSIAGGKFRRDQNSPLVHDSCRPQAYSLIPMRTTLLLLLATLIPPGLAAQQPNAPVTGDYDRRQKPAEATLPPALVQGLTEIRDAALSDDYAYHQVAHLTENIGPRAVGSPQAQAAIDYVAGEMRRLGLEVRLEPVHARHWIRGAETAELVEYPGQAPGTTQKIVLTALGGNHPTPAQGIIAEVIVVNSFADLDRLGREQVKGKIVLFNVAFDKQKAAGGFAGEAYDEAVTYRSQGAKRAAALGAAASLIRSVGGADYRLPHAGNSQAADIPAGAVTSEDADLIAHLAAQGKVRMHLVLTSQTAEEVTTYNVIGDLKGSEHPEQIVIVSGHLDSWDLGTGAIDDAAGVAVAMETAKLVQQLHLRPKRTLRVIAWIDEENLGRGHVDYARAHASEIGNHVAALESDLGASHPMGFRAKITPEAAAQLQPVLDILRPLGANLIDLSSDSPEADIEPLAKQGVPAFGLLQDGRIYFNYHHTPADTLDKIVPRELQENATAMAVMGYALASMPDALPR